MFFVFACVSIFEAWDGTWNSFCATLKIEILTKLMVLLAGTMIFELAVKNDTESTYFLLIFDFFFINRSGTGTGIVTAKVYRITCLLM